MNPVIDSSSSVKLHKVKTKSKIWKEMIRDRYLYLLLLPVIAYYLLFKYGPMYGILMAFKEFRVVDGIWGSPWVGFKYFERLFNSPDFFAILKNTILLNVYGLVLGFPVPVLLAILINEIRSVRYKKVIQSSLYVPHFISWIVLGGIFIGLLSPSSGIINIILVKVFHIKPIYFMASTFWWPVMYVISGIWQSAGWGTIIYLAAISGIDAELFEAAQIDGANKFKQIWHITLPAIRGTVAIMLILRMGYMLDVGFEQIFILQNPAVRSVADVISTYVYRNGVQNGLFSLTTAVGLFQSVVGLILVVTANKIVKSFGEGGLW